MSDYNLKEVNRPVGLLKAVEQLLYWSQISMPQVYGEQLSYANEQGVIVAKVNEVIQQLNVNTEWTEYLLNEGVEQETVDYINELIQNGTLGSLINNELLGDINQNIDDYKNKINQEINDFENTINTKVNSIITPSPAGVYPNIASIPTSADKTRIYLTSNDGHWVYWNGTEWVDGGLYQSMAIANGSITRSMLKNATRYGEILSGFVNVDLNTLRIKSSYEMKINTYGAFIVSYNEGQILSTPSLNINIKDYYDTSGLYSLGFDLINSNWIFKKNVDMTNEVNNYIIIMTIYLIGTVDNIDVNGNNFYCDVIGPNSARIFINRKTGSMGQNSLITADSSTLVSQSYQIKSSFFNYDSSLKTLTLNNEGYLMGENRYIVISSINNKVIDLSTVFNGNGTLVFSYNELTNSIDVNNAPANASCVICTLYFMNYSIQLDARGYPVGYSNDNWLSFKIDGKYVGLEEGSYSLLDDYSTENDRFVLPTTLYNSDKLNNIIHENSIISYLRPSLSLKLINNSTGQEILPCQFNDINADSDITAMLTNVDTVTNRYYKNLIVRYKKGEITNKNISVNMLGDSLTNRYVGYYVKNNMDTLYSATTTMVGTMQNLQFTGEGREGWTFSNFIGRDNIYHGNGAKITPQVTKGVSSLTLNPFIKLATEQDKTDHPSWCFRNTGSIDELTYEKDPDKTGDFYIFDYANYLGVQQINEPTIISIALGTNDYSYYPSYWKESCLKGLTIMVTKILEGTTSAKIGIVPCTPVCRIDTLAKDRYVNMLDLFIQDETYINSINNNRCYIVGVHQYMDRNNIFDGVNKTSLNDQPNAYYDNVQEAIHFNTSGQKQYARAYCAWLAWVLR